MYWTARRTLNRYRPVQASSVRPTSPAASGEIRGDRDQQPGDQARPQERAEPLEDGVVVQEGTAAARQRAEPGGPDEQLQVPPGGGKEHRGSQDDRQYDTR